MITFFYNEIDGYTKERVFSIKLGIILLALIATGTALVWVGNTGTAVLEVLQVTN